LCAERDNVPKESPQRIETLKKTDPIFAKRHKQFVSAKVCNKAPKFDANDYYATIRLPKQAKVIKREQKEILSVVNNVQINKPKIYREEMEKVEVKVKEFVQNFVGF